MNLPTRNSGAEFEQVNFDLKHATSATDLLSIQSVSEVVYSLFQVDGGNVKLSGCSLEPTPILKLKLKLQSDASEIIYFSARGEFDQDFADSVKLEQFVESDQEPAWLKAPSKRAELDQLIETARARLDGDFDRVFHMTVYWCKYVEGKLNIEIGKQSGSVKFSGWAQRLVDGLESCPPFLCEHSGRSAYHVIVDDLGNMTVPDALGVCEATQQKVVESELQTCAVSGKRVLGSELWTCPATGSRILEEFATHCSRCGQKVAPEAVQRGVCVVCRSLSAAETETPTIQRIFDEMPITKTFKGWKESTCQGFAVIASRRGLNRFVFVIDLKSKTEIQVRKSNLLGMSWKTIAPDDLKS